MLDFDTSSIDTSDELNIYFTVQNQVLQKAGTRFTKACGFLNMDRDRHYVFIKSLIQIGGSLFNSHLCIMFNQSNVSKYFTISITYPCTPMAVPCIPTHFEHALMILYKHKLSYM